MTLATPTTQVDNDRTRVTEWRFAPGAETGVHIHEYDYVVVPLFDGFLDIELPSGETVHAPMTNGVPYFRELGVEHDVRNGNNFECAFVEVEFLEDRA